MRSRTVVHTLVRMCGIVLTVIAVRAHAAAQNSTPQLQLGWANAELIRCTAESDRPCFRFDLNVLDPAGSPDTVSGVAKPENFQVIQTGRIRRDLQPFFVSTDEDLVSSEPAKRYVLVLFDVSGSMASPLTPGGKQKIEIAKEALYTVLNEFREDSDLTAIAPFENHNLDSISRVPFVSTLDARRKQLEQMPPPKGDTGLFSAVVVGLSSLESQPAKSEKLLVVFTDGKNDVGDQHDLLTGETGLRKVVDRARESQFSIWTIGLGSGKDEIELRRIAYPDESHYIPATDGDALRRAFTTATRQFFRRIRVTVEVEDSFRKLVGGDRLFQIRFRTPSGAFLETPVSAWRSPVSGLEYPLLSGDAAETKAYAPWLKSHPGVPRLSRGFVQIATVVFYALLLCFLWFIVPRMLWPHRYQPDFEVQVQYGADTSAQYKRIRKPIEDPFRTVEVETFEIPDRLTDSGGQREDRGTLTTIFGEKRPESPVSETKSTPESTPPGTLTTIFGDRVQAHAAGAEEPSISKIFTAEEAGKDLRPSSRDNTEGVETLPLAHPKLQKPQAPVKEPPADPGKLKDPLDEPRWPERNLESTGPIVMSRRPIDDGQGEHPVVISGRRTKVSPSESIAPSPPPKNVAEVPPSPSEMPAHKAPDRRFVVLLVLNVTFLLLVAALLYFSLKR